MFGWFKRKLNMPSEPYLGLLFGSFQNPAWSPDGRQLVFTRFRNGYNRGPADIFIYDIESTATRQIVTAFKGYDNVSQPGSTWNKKTDQIVFSSDVGGSDDSYIVGAAEGSVPRRLVQGYEPSISPDAQDIISEIHGSENGPGRILRCAINSATTQWLTATGDDCRQPNWSPKGNRVVYQQQVRVNWELVVHHLCTGTQTTITSELPGDKTDATFSPDGKHILYSGRHPGGRDGLLVIPVEGGKPEIVLHKPQYYGAASFSPDGNFIVAETSVDDPDGGKGTTLEIINYRWA